MNAIADWFKQYQVESIELWIRVVKRTFIAKSVSNAVSMEHLFRSSLNTIRRPSSPIRSVACCCETLLFCR
jgi:hypothetical protein